MLPNEPETPIESPLKCLCPWCEHEDPENGCPYPLYSPVSDRFHLCFSCRTGLHAGLRLQKEREP